MTFLDILTLGSLILGFILTLCYAYQILYLFMPFFRRSQLPESAEIRRYAILIAARNEEAVLPYLLRSIRQQDYPSHLFTVFVVADNCTDCTAQAAEQEGATVFCRTNPHQVGKGYALDYLLRRIEETEGLDCFDAFLIFDADNLLESDYLRQINRVAEAGFDVFCGYRNAKNFGTNWISAGHAIWYLHESTHLNCSRMLLGNPCIVSGTGFGFTRQLLRRCGGWRFFTLTEDIEFSTWCVTHGVRMGYCHEAILYDEQPESFRQSWRQRTRWIQGGIQVSVRYGYELLRGMLKGGRLGYACLEAATLSLWGYGVGCLCSLLSVLCAGLWVGWAGAGKALLLSLVSFLISTFVMGFLTVLTQWRRIRAPWYRKVQGVLVFPLFMLTYVPIAVSAFFRKFHWPPITHSVAISARDLLMK